MFIWPKIKLKSAKLRKIKHSLAENISTPGPGRPRGGKDIPREVIISPKLKNQGRHGLGNRSDG